MRVVDYLGGQISIRPSSADTFDARSNDYDTTNITTAIIAADKLVSDIDVPIRIFNDKEYLKARELLFTEREKAMTAAVNGPGEKPHAATSGDYLRWRRRPSSLKGLFGRPGDVLDYRSLKSLW